MNLNATSAFFTSQAALPYLIETRGTIINFSSILASRPVAGLAAYSASKAAVEMLTKSLALELAPKKIRVLCVSPATIQTNFHTSAGMSQETAAKYYEASVSTHPIGRVGVPEDISELVAFLADSKKAGFMTGCVIDVDGGRLLTSAVAANLGR
jgi:NAD(P)-dependent dehydrogenase (short-subunit alcohol dehydrogenase family)